MSGIEDKSRAHHIGSDHQLPAPHHPWYRRRGSLWIVLLLLLLAAVIVFVIIHNNDKKAAAAKKGQGRRESDGYCDGRHRKKG